MSLVRSLIAFAVLAVSTPLSAAPELSPELMRLAKLGTTQLFAAQRVAAGLTVG